MKNRKLQLVTKGLLFENPVFVLVLGTCPTLAISTTVLGALGMGLAAMAVLICSNVAISALRKVIPDKVRIPCYIVVIAAFVTLVSMLMHAYLPSLYETLGIYLSLITVNCIILGRAEMFARENTIADSFFDGLGMGAGFTLALLCMALIREPIGSGTFAGLEIPFLSSHTVDIFVKAPGGFLMFGVFIAIVNSIMRKNKRVNNRTSSENLSCAGCPSAGLCRSACTDVTPDKAKEEK